MYVGGDNSTITELPMPFGGELQKPASEESELHRFVLCTCSARFMKLVYIYCIYIYINIYVLHCDLFIVLNFGMDHLWLSDESNHRGCGPRRFDDIQQDGPLDGIGDEIPPQVAVSFQICPSYGKLPNLRTILLKDMG